jgi:serine protease Do
MSTFDIEKLGVFQVFTGDGTGTGFLIDEKTLVTNCHVVEPFRQVAVEQRDKQRILGIVRRVSPKRDLAIVELSKPLTGEVLAVSPDDSLVAKQTIHIVGFPVGLPLSITEGVVSHPKQQYDGDHYVQTDAAINPGNSGGPMLDDQRRIVAVTTCKLSSADMVGFGVPASDVRGFIESYRGQTAEFGVVCPSCDDLLETPERYCNSCGSDLEHLELETYFEEQEPHPITAFVENALRMVDVDPVLARHGDENWSFHAGSAPIQIWSCCSEHLNFSSSLAEVGKQKLGDLFRFLLSEEHAPFSFDLSDSTIRLNLVFHMADVFGQKDPDDTAKWIKKFLEAADRYDNLLIEKYGCLPAAHTQLTFLKEPTR